MPPVLEFCLFILNRFRDILEKPTLMLFVILMVLLCGKQYAKLLYVMIIYPFVHGMIGSSVECSGDFVLTKYSCAPAENVR